MSRQFWNINLITNIDRYSNGGLYDSTGGNAYTPPPPPVASNFLLLESGDNILLENDDKILLES